MVTFPARRPPQRKLQSTDGACFSCLYPYKNFFGQLGLSNCLPHTPRAADHRGGGFLLLKGKREEIAAGRRWLHSLPDDPTQRKLQSTDGACFGCLYPYKNFLGQLGLSNCLPHTPRAVDHRGGGFLLLKRKREEIITGHRELGSLPDGPPSRKLQSTDGACFGFCIPLKISLGSPASQTAYHTHQGPLIIGGEAFCF